MTDGISLARNYYHHVVAPLLDDRWPHLPRAAARLGSGSDILGLDDETSRDHDWGLRLTLLVEPAQVAAVSQHFELSLPDTYQDLPTRFATSWDLAVRHRVQVDTAEAFVAGRLGLDVSGTLTGVDWLCLTGQALLEVTAGAVFVDDLGTLTGLREKLAWYPDDLWCYVLAADWIRLGEDLPLLGRAGHRGDELGSRVVSGRIVSTAIHLAFLLSRRWPPYPKWSGTLLRQLPVARDLLPALAAVLAADRSTDRQEAVAQALVVVHEAQRQAGLPTTEGPPTEPFFGRPFLAVRAPVPDLLLQAIADPLVRALPPGVGSVEQWVDNVRVLTSADRVSTARSHLTAASTPPLL